MALSDKLTLTRVTSVRVHTFNVTQETYDEYLDPETYLTTVLANRIIAQAGIAPGAVLSCQLTSTATLNGKPVYSWTLTATE